MSAKKMTLRQAIDQPKLRFARDYLRLYHKRSSNLPSLEEIKQCLSELKQEAVNIDDQVTAKAIWCLETVSQIQEYFLSAFSCLKAGDYQEAWNQLAHCESQIRSIDKHLTEGPQEFGIEHARGHTRQLQELYLLEWGFSPGLIKKEVHCSICDTRLTLRNGCGHKNGEIYDGELCVGVVKQAEILHISLVKNPAQKFTVIFPNGNDDLRLGPIKLIGQTLNSPWDSWSYHKETRRRHHPLFKDLGRNDRCPCNSGQKYKKCCLGKEEMFPHFQFSFGRQTLIEPPKLEVHTTRFVS